jgi:formate hydrogenlyase subunit 3/multisubunit Na+/H+ antiporter MnhD subunit
MGGSLLVLSIVVPIAGVLLAFAAGERHGRRVALLTMPIGLAIAVAIAAALRAASTPLVYLLGGWTPPLGVALRANGLSAVMLTTTAVVICAIGMFARADVAGANAGAAARPAFWMLLLAVWGALNAVFLGGDLFTLYVALELLTFAAVPLVALDGRAETLRAALRYLLFALLGSLLYLVGTALLYGAYGTLDIILLSQLVHAQPATITAATLMTVGLLAKTALFPLHLWLPPAHAGAPAAASAALSALVIKGSFFIVVRLWFDVMPALPGAAAAQLLAALGAAAILFGSVVALRQQRLKLLIAYSTLAQIGYLFLMFPLAFDPRGQALHGGGAATGGIVQAVSHATAKASMFMAAGVIYEALGHDRMAGLAGIGRSLPTTLFAFGLAGVALIGLPPSGAYLAKALLLQAADATAQWWWAVVVQAGGILTSSYVLLVLAHAVLPRGPAAPLRAAVPRMREVAALVLALSSLTLGLIPWHDYLALPPAAARISPTLETLLSSLWPILLGAVIAILIGPWQPRLLSMPGVASALMRRTRRSAAAFVRGALQVDGTLRQWPAAGLALAALAIGFGIAMLAGHAPPRVQAFEPVDGLAVAR